MSFTLTYPFSFWSRGDEVLAPPLIDGRQHHTRPNYSRTHGFLDRHVTVPNRGLASDVARHALVVDDGLRAGLEGEKAAGNAADRLSQATLPERSA